MQSSKVLNIGMMLEDINTDFSKELVKSVVNSIHSDRNIRLIVLSGKYYDDTTEKIAHEYRTIHNSVFRLGEICRFDGMIVHLGSMSRNISDFLHGFLLKTLGKMPKVFIGLDDPELVTVNYDNASGIDETVNYLVNICGLTRFCMLGGREDNKDARIRKKLFTDCLEKNGIPFAESCFINTGMSEFCTEEAEKLLDDNPGVQAIFCVNDASAKGLYRVMEQRELVPGRDIMVFGFDNTNMSGELIPPLASIGAYGSSLGQKSLELLISMINGEEAHSELIGTRLYGRDSLPYEMYYYNSLEMINVDPSFIYRMFDDCFYRYRSAYRDREMIDLRRLFFEILSRMLLAMKQRYMSIETFDELGRMIDIFFDNGAVRYTDAAKLIDGTKRLQDSMNREQRSAAAAVKVNRLFLRIKDRAVIALSKELTRERKEKLSELSNFNDFTADSMGYCSTKEESFRRILSSVNKLGVSEAAFYMYEKPFRYVPESCESLPLSAELKCVVRKGVTRLIPEARQRSHISEIFEKKELPKSMKGCIVFPVFHLDMLYGILLCSADGDIFEKGDNIALSLGRAVYLNDISS